LSQVFFGEQSNYTAPDEQPKIIVKMYASPVINFNHQQLLTRVIYFILTTPRQLNRRAARFSPDNFYLKARRSSQVIPPKVRSS
jgi:hypothetical protein